MSEELVDKTLKEVKSKIDKDFSEHIKKYPYKDSYKTLKMQILFFLLNGASGISIFLVDDLKTCLDNGGGFPVLYPYFPLVFLLLITLYFDAFLKNET